MQSRIVIQVGLLVLPWRVRRVALERLFGYRIHPTAWVGKSIVSPRELELGPWANIGHFTAIRGLDRVTMGEGAVIGRGNWIYAIPSGTPTLDHEPDRRPELVIAARAGVGHRHILDCSNAVSIGRHSGLVGHRSQVITHQIDIVTARTRTRPITIGDFCMVGSGSVVLGGAVLPDRSMLGAGSTLRSAFTEPQMIYAGVPAESTGVRLPDDAAFFDPQMR